MTAPGTATLRFPIPADAANLPLDVLVARAHARIGLTVLAAHREADELLLTVSTTAPWEAPA